MLALSAASAASRASRTGSSSAAKLSTAYLWALATSAWARLRMLSASALARSQAS